jgi:hypothetical protein
MEGIKEIIASLEQVLEQLRAVAPEESEEQDSEPETEEAESSPPAKSEDGFAAKKPMLVAMLKRNLK